jgi:putative cardiolipin synthase
MKAFNLFLPLFIVFGSFSNAFADKVRLLDVDHDALQARVDLVQQAKSEILAEYFSVWNDDQSVGGFALILDAARRGVKVKIVMDALSNKVPKAILNVLAEKGRDAQGNQNIEIKIYNPLSLNLKKLTHRDHSKMLIVDGKRMIIGGRNIGDKYFGLNKKRNFTDLDVMVEGETVKKAREDFLLVFDSKTVKTATDEDKFLINLENLNCERSQQRDMDNCENRKKHLIKMYHKENDRLVKVLEDILKIAPGDIVTPNTNNDWLVNTEEGADLEFISQQPTKLVSKDTNDLSDALLALTGTAHSDLNILSPYLIPTKNTYLLFDSLLKRGIKVRVITNSLRSTDNLFAQAGYLSAKEKMIQMGIELYEYNGPDTAHAKCMVMDNSVAFVGTFNLDPRSSFLNREVGVLIKSTPGNEFAEGLTQEIEKFRGNAILVGKDGVDQNVEEQKKLMQDYSKFKKGTLNIIRLLTPLFKSQV